MGILRWLFGCNCQTCDKIHDKYKPFSGWQPSKSTKITTPPPKKP